MREELAMLAALLAPEKSAASDAVVVSVLRAKGSAPRGAGALMVVGEQNGVPVRLAGTVGGGPLEYHAQQQAAALLAGGGGSRLQWFALNAGEAGKLGMICGGEVLLLYWVLRASQPDHREMARELAIHASGSEPAWLVWSVYPKEEGEDRPAVVVANLFDSADTPPDGISYGFQPALREEEGVLRFVLPLAGGERVFIFGGGHLAQKLVPLLAGLAFQCTVFDDRPEFADSALFPEAERVLQGEFRELAGTLGITGEDYAVVVTRGHAADYTVLERLLRRPAAYTGVVGSRAKTAAVNEKLRAAGISQEAINRVHTPIGLPIGAQTPAEIAVSIAAELIQVRAERRKAGI